MQKGDKNQQDLPRTSEEIPETVWPSEATQTSLESSHKIASYYDAVKVLSEVELPSPTPVLATGSLTEESNVIRLHEGESSGTKRKADEIEGNVERERELKNQQHDFRDPGHQRLLTTDTNTTNKRRRNLISERIRVLRTLVPNCNKRDEASILSDAIEYIKYLQMQVQTISTQGLYMFLARQPSWQVPNLGPPFSVRPLIGMQQGIPHYGFYAPSNIPVFPPAFSGFTPPLMPPSMQVGSGSLAWQHPSPLLYPQQLQFPLQQFSAQTSGYSTASSSGIIIPTTSSQAGSTVPGQPSYHVPVTTQGT